MYNLRIVRFALLAILLLLTTGTDRVLAAKPVNKNPLRVVRSELLTPTDPLGKSRALKIAIELAPEHHAYLDQFKLEIAQPPDSTVNVQNITPVVEFNDKFSKKIRQGVKGSGEILAIVEFPQAPEDFGAQPEIRLTYQACTDEYCLLPKTIDVPTVISSRSDSSSGKSRMDWMSNTLAKGYFTLFLVVFGAGILTSFTPCVFPMIPITLAVLGARTERSKRRSFLLSLFYVLGIASTYSVLGLIAATTGSLFGSFLGHPFVSLGLAFLFLMLALGSFGLFEIQAPAFVRDRLSLHKTKGGIAGAFFAGQVAGIIASPCVGPVLAAVLAFIAKSQNLALGFLLMFVFALGMGQLFLLLGTFSHAVQWLPKSGKWMLAVKYVFGLTFVALAAFYAYPAVKNQGWVETTPEYARLPFEKYSDEALLKAQQDGKPVLIDFYADWCVACKELETLTFSQPQVQAFKDQFVFLKVDATRPDKQFESLRRKYEIFGLPHLVIYDRKGAYRPDLTLTGFEKADAFAQRLKQAF